MGTRTLKGNGKVCPRTGHEGPEWEEMYSSTLPLTSAMGGWVINATPWTLYPRERPGTDCIGGWFGPGAGQDRCGKSRSHWDSIPGPSFQVCNLNALYTGDIKENNNDTYGILSFLCDIFILQSNIGPLFPPRLILKAFRSWLVLWLVPQAICWYQGRFCEEE
jgi:hypothetical protein